MLSDAVASARAHGLIEAGDIVVVTGGAAGSKPGTTNLIRVQVVRRILVSGTGVGGRRVHGKVKLLGAKLPKPAEIVPADILLVEHSTRELVPLARKAGGLIAEEAGLDSHAAQMAVELGISAVVGAARACTALTDGQEIELDPVSGRVFEVQETR
jgi:pyruvate kinase